MGTHIVILYSDQTDVIFLIYLNLIIAIGVSIYSTAVIEYCVEPL